MEPVRSGVTLGLPFFLGVGTLHDASEVAPRPSEAQTDHVSRTLLLAVGTYDLLTEGEVEAEYEHGQMFRQRVPNPESWAMMKPKAGCVQVSLVVEFVTLIVRIPTPITNHHSSICPVQHRRRWS